MAREVVAASPSVRDAAIDVARGMAILLVVLGHNGAISRSSPHFVSAIFLFHVPLFFLLSGSVFRRGGTPGVVSKLSRRLLLPCFATALAVGALKTVVRDESWVEMLVGILWATGQTLPWSHLWFLPTLFLSLMLVQSAGGLFERRPWLWLGVTGIVAFASFPIPVGDAVGDYTFTYPVGLPWGIDLVPLCVLFVLFGYLLQVRPMISHLVRTPAVGVVAAIVFAGCVVLTRTDLNLRVFEPFGLSLLAAISGCLLSLNVAALLTRFALPTSMFALLGRHTMPIFLLHVSIQKSLLNLDLEWLAYQAWLSGALAAATAIVVSIMIERYLMARVGLLRYLFLPERAA
jgi:fucose 4-O-acetylase-like acetyltransferase